jgi:dihydrodipicolinate reductase
VTFDEDVAELTKASEHVELLLSPAMRVGVMVMDRLDADTYQKLAALLVDADEA